MKTIDLGYKHGRFCIFFVYSRDNGNVVIKGESSEVDKLIEKKYSPSVVNKTWWNNGKGHSCWGMCGDGGRFSISSPARHSRVFDEKRRNKFEFYSYKEKRVLLSLRRMPKKWIPEYDEILL